MDIPDSKKFSIVKAKVKSILTADYVGCPKCKRKIDKHCAFCNIDSEVNYSYGKVILEENGSTVEVIVFD
jgi:hypothetical protein